MRQDRVAAAVAIGILSRFQVEMAPARALAGMGGSSLWYGHGVITFSNNKTKGKTFQSKNAPISCQGVIFIHL